MSLRSVCPTCGSPFERTDTTAQCNECAPVRSTRPNHTRKGTPESRGYDRAWRRLSQQARREQPFCSDCGSVHDLTADHTPEAWRRKERGQAIRLQDIDVVCRRCNAERGAARGARTRQDTDAPLAHLLRSELDDGEE